MNVDLQDTTLFKTLRRRTTAQAPLLSSYLTSSYPKIERYLAEIRRYFLHFTDHSIQHSVRILDNVARILKPAQVRKLTDIELYLLIASALVHDIGMVVSESDAREFASDPRFRNEVDAIRERLGIVGGNDWQIHGVERLVVAEYVRGHHARRCSLVLANDPGLQSILGGGNDELVSWVEAICAGHTMDFEDLLDESRYPTEVLVSGAQTANIRFLAVCLRLGDLLDISTPRAEPFLRFLSEPLSVVSASHWDQYRDIRIRNLGPGKTIVIDGKSPTQAAEGVLREWVSWMIKESEQTVLALNSGPDHYRLQVGRIENRVSAACDEAGTPLYEFSEFRFNLDEEQVMSRLFGERLYGRATIAIRELLQNAVDATRAKVAVDLKKSDNGWSTYSKDKKNHAIQESLKSLGQKWAIEVEARERFDSTGARLWVSIRDNGIGMSRETIEKYLLKVGRSRWTRDPTFLELGISTVGQFGIGFLSVFMISDRIVIETQSCLPGEHGIRATVYNWRSYLATQPLDRGSAGTTMSFRVSPNHVDECREIANLVRTWAPFLPMEVRVRGNGDELSIPGVHAGRYDRFRQTECVEFSDRSIVALGPRPGGRAMPRDACLSQDGLLVPDVPPPLGDDPKQVVLRSLSAWVELRGHDRFPLDLSRNLVEGGAAEMWDQVIDKIWEGIGNGRHRFAGAASALKELAQHVFDESYGRDLVVLSRDGQVLAGEPGSMLSNTETLVVQGRDVSNAPSNMEVLLLGDLPQALEPGSLASAKRWAIPGEEHRDEADLTIARGALSHVIGPLISRYRFISNHCQNGLLFSQSASTGSVPLKPLGFLRLSRNWAIIRSPYLDEGWRALHSSDFLGHEVREYGSFDFEIYVCMILRLFWPRLEAWRSCWPNESGPELSNAVFVAEIGAGMIGPSPDELEGDQYERWLEERDIENLYDPTKLTALIDELSNEDLTAMRPFLTPWDLRSWETGEWRAEG